MLDRVRGKQAVASLWRALPVSLRRRVLWLTQSTFTVGVSALLLDDRNHVLLLRHRFRESSRWELPGGFVSRGEGLEAAIEREIREETGYSVEILSQAGARVTRPLHVDVSFLARVRNGRLVVDTDEIIEAGFFPLDELPGLDPEQRRTIRYALQRAPE